MFREYLHCVYQTLIKGGRQPRSRRVAHARRPAATHLAVVGLEDRMLLSTLTLTNGALIYAPSTSVANSLRISDNPATHRYTFVDYNENITLVGNFSSPSYNGPQTVSFGDGNITSIAVNTGNQDFTVYIEQTLAVAPLTVDLGNGNDVVNISSGARNLNNIQGAIRVNYGLGIDTLDVHDESNTAAQTFSMAAGSLSRSGAAPITYTLGLDYVTVYAGQGNNVFNVSGVEPNYATTLFTGNGHDTVNVNDTSIGSSFTIDAGTGADTINVRATSSAVYVNGNGQDTVNLGNAGSVHAIQGSVTITDPPAGDYATVNVDDSADTTARTAYLDALTFDGAAYGRITGLAPADILYKYADTNTVTVQTGTGGATVNALATGVPVNLIGHGTNTVNVGNAGSVQAINALLTITDPPAGDYVTVNVDDSADATPRTVNLDTVTSGGVAYGRITGLAPADIEYKYADTYFATVRTGSGGAVINALATGVPVNLIGYSVNTTVNVGHAGSVQAINALLTITDTLSSGTINVDDSADATAPVVFLDTTAIGGEAYGRITGLAPAPIQYGYAGTNTVTVQTGTGGALVNLLVTGVPVNLIGNPSGPISLAASDAANTWTITSQDAGTLSSSLLAGTVTFGGAANLYGGNGWDTFVFDDGAGVDGIIDGGGGTNTLDYSPYTSSLLVDLQTGFATGVGGGIANIQNVTGGSSGGAGVYNLLVGNGGNVLVGGDGRRNLLIAGATASTLIGGNDDDILIGGTTAYDTEAGLVSLQAIMDYWSSTADDYATRVANLLSGNGVPLLDATMVTNNGGGNTLLGNHGGGSEMNLFYGMDPTLETTDYNPAIGEQFINC
jgi:hypothetical protein